MIRAAALAALVIAAGCSQSVGPFVRDIRVHGRELVVEKCFIDKGAGGISVGACHTEVLRLPAAAAAPRRRSAPPATDGPQPLTRAQVQAGIAPAVTAVRDCGDRNGVTGVVRLRITIDGDGRVPSVEPDGGGEAFASCVRAAFAAVQFPRSGQSVTVTYPVQMTDPAP